MGGKKERILPRDSASTLRDERKALTASDTEYRALQIQRGSPWPPPP